MKTYLACIESPLNRQEFYRAMNIALPMLQVRSEPSHSVSPWIRTGKSRNRTPRKVAFAVKCPRMMPAPVTLLETPICSIYRAEHSLRGRQGLCRWNECEKDGKPGTRGYSLSSSGKQNGNS